MARHERSLGPEYFERLFAADPDPWGFETRAYEARKYDHTLAALRGRRFRRGFEIGCANGVLTRRLADRCDSLLAIDVSATALARARARCADLPHVRFAAMRFPRQVPDTAPFDLIVVSEVAYYWDRGDLARAGAWLRGALAPGGTVILVHWTGETDYPQSAGEAVEGLYYAVSDLVDVCRADRRPDYRLDLWRRFPVDRVPA